MDRLSELTGYQIDVDEIELYLWKGLGVRAYHLDGHQKNGLGRIRASEALVFVDAFQLLRGRVVPKRLHVERPIIDIALPEKSELEEGKLEARLLSLLFLPRPESLTIEKGSLFIRDFPLRFVNLSLQMKSTEAGTLNVKSQGEARLRRESTAFRVQGVIAPGREKEKMPSADFSFEAAKMPLRWIPFPQEIPVTSGLCNAQLRIELKSPEPARVSGKILVDSAGFSIRKKGRTKDYSIAFMTFDFRSLLESGKIHVPYLNFRTPDASFSVNLGLDLREKGNPYLRLEAKSLFMTYAAVETLFPSPLVASWVETDLFPLLRSGDVLLESFLIDGKMLQLKNLELAENEPALSMGFVCRGFTVHGDRLREPLREVSAKVLLKDGVLLVSALKGVSGKSEIQEGMLKVRNVFLPHPAVETSVQGSFDVEDVLHQCKAEFLPARFRKTIESLVSASGTVEGRAGFKYDSSMEAPQITEADLRLRSCAFKQEYWPFSLVLDEGRLNIGEEGRFKGSGSWGDSSFEGEAGFSMQGLSVDPQWMEVVARLDLGQLESLISPGRHAPLSKASVLCRTSITRNPDRWSIKGTADMSDLSVDHELFVMNLPGGAGSLSFDADLYPEKLMHINKFLWKPGTSSLHLLGDYPLSPESDITLQCSVTDFSLEDLGIRLKPGGFPATGSLKGNLQVTIPRKDLSNAAVSGDLSGENLSFHLTFLPSPVRGCDFGAQFSGDKIMIPFLTLMTGESALEAKGEIRGWKGLKGALTVNSTLLNISDFIPPRKEAQQEKRSSFVENASVQVYLDAQPAFWKKVVSERLKAELQFRGDDLHVVASQIRMDRGSLEVTGYVKDDAMAFSGHVEFKDQPVEALLKRLAIEPVYEGSLTMEAQLYTEGKTLADLISNLDGRTNVLIEKGVIRKSNVFLQILEFLSLQNIFTKRPPDISKEGLYFESLGGHGQIEKGVVRTENAQMKSPVLNAVAAGSADLMQGLADFDLGVQPLGTVDTVVSNLPILGHILTGENKSLITYYFEVKGPILNPQVEHVPFRALGEGVAGILRRLFLSPVKLFEDISGSARKAAASGNVQIPSSQHSGH